MDHPLFARDSASGPADLPALARMLHEAGCTAAAWLVEAEVTRAAADAAEIERLQDDLDMRSTAEEVEDAKREAVEEVQVAVADVLTDLDGIIEQKGALKKADLKVIAERLNKIAYPE